MVQASNSEVNGGIDQEDESTSIEFIGSPYEVTDERQLGRSVSYAGIIGELEIANEYELALMFSYSLGHHLADLLKFS